MPPSAPIDSSIGNSLIVLEQASVWRANGYGAGEATWLEVNTAAAFQVGAGVSDARFLRVVARGNILNVLAMAQTPAQAGSDNYTLYCINSLNDGQTWSVQPITEFAFGQPNYYIDTTQTVTPGGSDNHATVEILDKYAFRCHGYFDAGDEWHQMQIYVTLAGHYTIGVPDSIKVKVTGTLPPIASTPAAFAAGLSVMWGFANWATASYLGDDVYLIDGINYGWAPEYQRFRLWYGQPGTTWAGGYDFTLRIIEVDGAPVAAGPPTAFDVAPSNPNYIYASVGDAIYRTSASWIWGEFFGEHGANDICVDPQMAGAIYYVSTEGSLNLMVAQASGLGVVTSEGLDSETPTRVPLRICRDVNSGRLWFLNGGATLKCRNLGSWTEQKTGLSGGRGIHAYAGGKLIFVDAANIWISDDWGATITAKKGGWSGYGSGVNGHRL